MSRLPDLDPLIHAPARLRILSTLAVLGTGDTITFTRLQGLLEMTAGNLLTHLRKLKDAGYVDMTSQQQDQASKTTTVSLTPQGRTAFDEYRDALQTWLGADPARR